MRLMHHLRTGMCVIIATLSTSCGNTDRRYPPILQSDEKYAPPTQEQKLWALATCAILTESNQGRHDILGGCERTPEEIKAWQDCLAKWWGDTNREDLLGTLKWIENGGHRREFDEMARDLSAATPAQLASIKTRFDTNPSVSNKIKIVLQYKDIFRQKSITAWDYDRYISLCGWGYIAGYISEEEAWQRIMPAARLLQKTFISWLDLGNNHVVGREFWSWKQAQKEGTRTRQCFGKLLTNASSPWLRLKWDMNLTPPNVIDIKTENQSSDHAR